MSTSCFKNIFVEEAVKQCGELGVYDVELSSPHSFEPLDLLGERLIDLKESGFHFTIHNFFPPPENNFVLNIASGNKEICELNEQLVKSALALAQHIGASLYGIHAGYLADARSKADGMFCFEETELDYASSLENATRFVRSVAETFEKDGVELLLENLFPSGHGQYSLFCTMKEINEFMALVPNSVSLLLDLGHLNISSHMLGFNKYKFLEKLLVDFGDRLLEVHLSENNGHIDKHLPLMRGSWQFEAIKAIKSIPPSAGRERIYCLEARQADRDELRSSLDLINSCLVL